MNERLTAIRTSLKLTTRKFGEKINLTGGAITNMEKGKRNITDRVIADVCREFNVNETWFREGIGEMFIPKDSFSLDEYLKERNCSDIEKRIITMFVKSYLQLPEDQRDTFIDTVIEKAKKEIKSNNSK